MVAQKETVSRQRKLQRRYVAEGRCMCCGKKRVHYAVYCDEHAVHYRKYKRNWERAKRGQSPDTIIGSQGRDPIVPED